MLVTLGLATILILGVLTFVFYRIGQSQPRIAVDFSYARGQFAKECHRLRAEFFQTAAHSGKPRGLRWKDCAWSDTIAFARDRQTGQLLALVAVTISFEAIEGGDMEGVEAVGNLRNASAVFYFDAEWRTIGRVVFNLNPDEAIEHFKTLVERIPPETSG